MAASPGLHLHLLASVDMLVIFVKIMDNAQRRDHVNCVSLSVVVPKKQYESLEITYRFCWQS